MLAPIFGRNVQLFNCVSLNLSFQQTQSEKKHLNNIINLNCRGKKNMQPKSEKSSNISNPPGLGFEGYKAYKGIDDVSVTGWWEGPGGAHGLCQFFGRNSLQKIGWALFCCEDLHSGPQVSQVVASDPQIA